MILFKHNTKVFSISHEVNKESVIEQLSLNIDFDDFSVRVEFRTMYKSDDCTESYSECIIYEDYIRKLVIENIDAYIFSNDYGRILHARIPATENRKELFIKASYVNQQETDEVQITCFAYEDGEEMYDI